MAKRNRKNSNSKDESTNQSSGSQGGMFSFQNIMDDFYGMSTDGDAGLTAQKQAYQGNMVQSGFDSMLAQQMATHNSALAQENMTHQADLEQRNQAANMKNEFKDRKSVV